MPWKGIFAWYCDRWYKGGQIIEIRNWSKKITPWSRRQAQRCRSQKPAPLKTRRSNIQLPYFNTFESIWEYQNAFTAGKIDFSLVIGPVCPICMQNHCCRRITPYERNAIDLFPDFRNDRISVARFLCQTRKKTFSLLPVQLIPYMQYTAAAVLCTLLAGFGALAGWHERLFGGSGGSSSG